MESLHAMRTLRASAPHQGDPGLHVVPQQQDLQRLRHHQPETEAGTNLDLRHMRDPA